MNQRLENKEISVGFIGWYDPNFWSLIFRSRYITAQFPIVIISSRPLFRSPNYSHYAAFSSVLLVGGCEVSADLDNIKIGLNQITAHRSASVRWCFSESTKCQTVQYSTVQYNILYIVRYIIMNTKDHSWSLSESIQKTDKTLSKNEWDWIHPSIPRTFIFPVCLHLYQQLAFNNPNFPRLFRLQPVSLRQTKNVNNINSRQTPVPSFPRYVKILTTGYHPSILEVSRTRNKEILHWNIPY